MVPTPSLSTVLLKLRSFRLQKDFHLNGDSPQTARLNSALQKCLAKNRNDRYSSIDEMQEIDREETRRREELERGGQVVKASGIKLE